MILFESGAIVLHIATRHSGLLPADAAARARAINWIFAALGAVEPSIVEREAAGYLELDEPWFAQRLRSIEERIHDKLGGLFRRLGDADWLDGDFSAGDLMMVDVLRRLGGSALLEAYPTLVAYVGRTEARPAFRRAFDAQRAFFHDHLTPEDPEWNRPSTSSSRATASGSTACGRLTRGDDLGVCLAKAQTSHRSHRPSLSMAAD